MRRLIELLFENMEMTMNYLPGLIITILIVVIAFFCNKNFKHLKTNLIVMGAVLKVCAYISTLFIRLYLIPSDLMADMHWYFTFNSLLYSASIFCFLYGIYRLLKTLNLKNNNDHDDVTILDDAVN